MTPGPSKRGKFKSHPTSKARNRRQKAKKKAARDGRRSTITYLFTGRGCQRDRATVNVLPTYFG
jgi:hypothetical protein